MSDNKKHERKQEEILMALDQVSQTIEVMSKVVSRLRRHIATLPDMSTEKSSKLAASPPIPQQQKTELKEKVIH